MKVRLHTVPHRDAGVNLVADRVSTHYASAMTNRDDENTRRARKDLETLRDSDNVFTGSVAPMLRRAKTHFSGTEEDGDAVEVWGKRIGRGLSLIVFVALAIYLYLTYVR